MTGFGQYLTLFASAIPDQPLGKMPALLMKDVLLIVGASLALLFLLVLWAKYLRNAKPKRRRRGGQKVFRGAGSSEETEEAEEAAAEDRRRFKFRYKRRDHRSRNPTLAETGGLPPVRTEEPTKPS